MKKNYIALFVLSVLAIGSVFLVNKVFAENSGLANIQYPVKELGSCKSKADCKLFCDNPANTNACLDFASNKKLMSVAEINTAKKFIAADNAPGGCKTKEACSEYCDGTDHINECIAFAEKNDLMPPKDLVEAKKVQAAINNGAKPPACKGKQACDVYCEDSNHMEECINFGVAAGFIEGKDVENSQKMLQAVKKGIKPPACKGKQACDEYCSNPDHVEECMTFAAEAGMMSDQEKADSQKMIKAIKSGVKPPACKGKECDSYCQQAEHFDECTNFALAAGFMTEQDAVMARKTGGKGPGGCTNKEECNTFCNNPDNQETCFTFGKENGTIPEEDLKRMEDSRQQMSQTLTQAPPELITCLTAEIGSDMVERMKNGLMPTRDIGEKMQTCFQKGMQPAFGPQGQDQQNQQIMPWAEMCKPDANGNPTALACADESGKFVISAKVGSDGNPVCPAGSSAMCGNYHQQNSQQGQQGQSGDRFQPGPGNMNPGGQQMPQQAGPGGCKGPEECNTYCESHQEECSNFKPQQNQVQPDEKQSSQSNQQGQGLNSGSNQNNYTSNFNQNNSGQRLPQQQPGQPNQGVTTVGPCGTGPGTCSGIGPDDINPNKNNGGNNGGVRQPNQQGQSNQGGQPGQNQPGQRLPQQQPGQPNQGVTTVGPCGTGPGTCSGIGPDDINPNNGGNGTNVPNQPGQFNQGGQPGQPNQFDPNQNQPGQDSPPSSLNINRNQLVGSILYAFIRLLIGN